MALGKLGKGEKQEAAGLFRKVLDSDCTHLGVHRHIHELRQVEDDALPVQKRRD